MYGLLSIRNIYYLLKINIILTQFGGSTLKRKYFFVICMLLVVLAMSFASAADNNTDIFQKQSDEVISINENDLNNISISNEDNEVLEVVSDDNSSDSNVTDEVILGSADNSERMEISPSEKILSSTVSVKPLSSSGYKEPTLSQRTFKIGNFKAVLSKAQYKKLYQLTFVEDYYLDNVYNTYHGYKYKGYEVSAGGLRWYLQVKTNKFINVKLKVGNRYVVKKTRAIMFFSYGEGQCGVAYRYIAFLTHKFANPAYDYIKVLGKSAKYFKKCKQSKYLPNLNRCKLVSQTSVYKKYSYYNL